MSEVDLSLFPSLEDLATGLTSVLNGCRVTHDPVTIVDRGLDRHAATFPNEVVTCELADGRRLQVFCKYEASHRQATFGHKEGVPYEATVYRDVLAPLNGLVPKFYGSYHDPSTGQVWLVLEYLDQSSWIAVSGDPETMELAGRWIGRFHHINEERLSRESVPSLFCYDTEYYLGWARRTFEYARPLHDQLPWLGRLCDRFAELMPVLLEPVTVIHGEYYKKNVLISGETIYPVDWESAAVAVGEIDLAALTEGWEDEEIVRRILDAYVEARWPGGPPLKFQSTLDGARLYSHLRWLGERPGWTVRESSRWRFDELRALGEQLGLL